DVNYIAGLYGEVTDSNDPEHAFSVSGVEWRNVEGHYVRIWAFGSRLPYRPAQLPAFASAVRWARASASMASRVAIFTRSRPSISPRAFSAASSRSEPY